MSTTGRFHQQSRATLLLPIFVKQTHFQLIASVITSNLPTDESPISHFYCPPAFPRLLVQGDASYPSMKKFYHIPSLALFTAAVFICRLLVNLRPASQEVVIGKNLTFFDLAVCLYFFSVKLRICVHYHREEILITTLTTP